MKQLGTLLTLLFLYNNSNAMLTTNEDDESYFNTPTSPAHKIDYQLTEEDQQIIDQLLRDHEANMTSTQKVETTKNKGGRKSDSWKLLSSNSNKTIGICIFCNKELHSKSLGNLRYAAFYHRKNNPECFKQYQNLKNQ